MGVEITANGPHPCICNTFTRETADGEVVEQLGCVSDTRHTFAPGHDARLKGLLIRAGVAGQEVAWLSADGTRTGSDAQAVANRYGFGAQVAAGIARGLAKPAKRNSARSRVAAKVANTPLFGSSIPSTQVNRANLTLVPEAKPEPTVTVKIGRWEYAATIDDRGVATYTDKQGNIQTRERDSYRLLEA